jgi:hypothetical protein
LFILKMPDKFSIAYDLAFAMTMEAESADRPRCLHDGCGAGAIPCPIHDLFPDITAWYCPAHAPEHGHCGNCGSYLACYSLVSDLCQQCEERVQ